MKAIYRTAVATLALVSPAAVWAQTGPEPQGAGSGPASGPALSHAETAMTEQAGIEDIVVTANRRAEKLQNVGASISALSGEQMRELGVTTALDVANAALWLASDESGYTTGHTLTTDAGITIGATTSGPAFGEYAPMIREAGRKGL